MTSEAMRDLPERHSSVENEQARREHNDALALRASTANVTAPEDMAALLRLTSSTLKEGYLHREDVKSLRNALLSRVLVEAAKSGLKVSSALASAAKTFVDVAIRYGYYDRDPKGLRKSVTTALLAVPASWGEAVVFSRRENKAMSPLLFQTLVRCAPEVLAGRAHPLSIVGACIKTNDRDWQGVFREDIHTLLEKQFAADPLRTSLALGFVHRTWRSGEGSYNPNKAERIAAGDHFIETAFWIGAAAVEAARHGEVPIDDVAPGCPDVPTTQAFFDEHPGAVKMLIEMGLRDSAHARSNQREPLSPVYLRTMARPDQLAKAATGSLPLMTLALKINPACLDSLLESATKAQARQLFDLTMTGS